MDIKNIPEHELARLREKAKELRWPIYDLQSGHDAMLSHPHETINLFFKILSDKNH